jgi:hypothetical protein
MKRSLIARLTTTALLALTVASVALPSLANPTNSASQYLRAEQFESQLRFGPEWTLTSDELFASFPLGTPVVTTPYSKKMVSALQAAIESKYASRAGPKPSYTLKSNHSRWERDAFEIRYPNGYQITIFSDPGVLEINSAPSSQTTVEKNLSRIQSDIFDEGRKLGLEPGLFAGSGHMHIETTKLHPDTVRNFLADYYSHTGLAAGALNEDIYNSIGPGEMPTRNKTLLRKAFSNYDRFKARGLNYLVDQIQLSYDIRFEDESADYKESGRGVRPRKYFAASFKSYPSIGTVEIRAIRPQASAEAYLKLVKMWVARMKVAEIKRELGIKVPLGSMKSLRGDPQAVLADFDHYLEEAGLKLSDYREFVMPYWQNEGGEFDQYLAKKERKAARTCSELFKSS